MDYVLKMEPKYGCLELVDVPAVVKENTHPWFNQTLCRVNDAVIRLGIIDGEFHWHKHDEEDEFFFVLSGRLVIELRDKTVELGPRQGFTVPKGVEHKPRTLEPVIMLMVEKESVQPTGD